MFEDEIENLTNEELLDKSFIPSIYENYEDDEERQDVLNAILVVAKKNKVLKAVKSAIDRVEKSRKSNDDSMLFLTIGKHGAEVTINNYKQAILNNKKVNKCIRFNTFINKFEHKGYDKVWRIWTDDDDAWLMSTLEEDYNIYDKQKFYAGLSLCKEEFAYHPIKNIIEEDKWDGQPRIDNFLSKIMKCKDDIYSREVSRMIFYGGINRLYNPGCKFDYMPILMGLQGTCKSTIVSWLALDDKFYREVLSIDGKDGMEILQGGWICEFSELLAMVRSREVESMKAYITRQVDTFRPAYGRNNVRLPRQCIFIGTTNTYEFLVDKTGNRRYLPIEINLEQGELYKDEKMVKEYILQCWREALELYKQGKTYLVIPREYTSIVEKHQEQAVEDDPKVGMIHDYLSKKEIGDKVCGVEIFTNALGCLQKKFSRNDSRDIANIMRTFDEWKKVNNPMSFDNYGRQKYWEKIK